MEYQNSKSKEEVSDVVRKNIRTMVQLRNHVEQKKTIQHKISSWISKHIGRFAFLLFQLIFTAVWIFINTRPSFDLPRFDPYPFPLLGLIATVEAIFLAIVILINQNHQGELIKRREELEIQVNLLTEHEVTRLIEMVDNIAKHLKISGITPDVQDLKIEIKPEKVLDIIENEIKSSERS